VALPRTQLSSFLAVVDHCERELAKILTLMLGIVIVAALISLIRSVIGDLARPGGAWLGDSLIKVLGDLLTVLIALEVLQNVTSYLRCHVVQVELVLVTALTAVARKVIVLPSGAEDKPQLLAGLGIAAAALAGAYWLVRHPLINRGETRKDLNKSFQDPDQFVLLDSDGMQ